MFGGWIHTQITKIGKNRPFLAGCLLVTGKSTSKLPSSHRASVAFRQPWIAMEWSVRVGACRCVCTILHGVQLRVLRGFGLCFMWPCRRGRAMLLTPEDGGAVKGPELNLKSNKASGLGKAVATCCPTCCSTCSIQNSKGWQGKSRSQRQIVGQCWLYSHWDWQYPNCSPS